MESYSYTSYGESGESLPHSRDVDFDNQQPWEHDQSNGSYKVKFMCSYGGKIHPRSHDNHLSYVGGETKILAVDRFVKFAAVMAKLTALFDGGDVSTFKYQLPGEDLDALISVTNDEDLQHMMHEYDRLNRAISPTPAKLRIFIFPVSGQSPALTPIHSFGSTEGRSERERFVDGLNHRAGHLLQSTTTPPSSEVMSRTPDLQMVGDPLIETAVVVDDRGIEADRIQKHIQDLQKLQVNAAEQEQQPAALYRKPSDDNLSAAAAVAGRDYHVPIIMSTTGYQISPDQQLGGPVYMIHQTPTGASSMYMPILPRTAPPVNQGQGYYVQRMPTEGYRDQPVYNVMPPAAQPPVAHVAVETQQTTVVPQQQQFRQQNVATTYTEGYRLVQSSTTDAQAAAYNNATGGRQIYYTNHGAVLAQPQHLTTAAAATLNQENVAKVVPANIKELI